MDSDSENKNLNVGRRQRVKGRFIRSGLDDFEDHEVLELLLFYCYPRIDTNRIAHQMINDFGGIHTLLEADAGDIAKKCGVTQNVALLVTVQCLSKTA